MRFRGHLLLPSEPGPGLRVDLEVADRRLAVVSEREKLGDWPLDAVRVRRLGGDTFAMTVAGEDLHFVAEDTISFAYAGLPAIERVSAPSQLRSPLRVLLGLFGHSGSESSDGPAVPVPQSPPVRTGAAPPSWADSPALRHQTVEEPEAQAQGRQAPGVAPEPAPEVAQTPASVSSFEDEPTSPPKLDQPDSNVIELRDWYRPAEDQPAPDETAQRRCPALRHDGLPCRSPVIGPSGYCRAHDPGSTVAQDFRKALEARARLKRKGVARLTRVYARLDRALRQVERGQLDPDKAVAMAQLARTMCAILELDVEPGAGEDSSPTP